MSGCLRTPLTEHEISPQGSICSPGVLINRLSLYVFKEFLCNLLFDLFLISHFISSTFSQNNSSYNFPLLLLFLNIKFIPRGADHDLCRQRQIRWTRPLQQDGCLYRGAAESGDYQRSHRGCPGANTMWSSTAGRRTGMSCTGSERDEKKF